MKSTRHHRHKYVMGTLRSAAGTGYSKLDRSKFKGTATTEGTGTTPVRAKFQHMIPGTAHVADGRSTAPEHAVTKSCANWAST